MQNIARFFLGFPPRLAAFLLSFVFFVPAVSTIAHWFPDVGKETVAVIFALCTSGFLNFHDFRR